MTIGPVSLQCYQHCYGCADWFGWSSRGHFLNFDVDIALRFPTHGSHANMVQGVLFTLIASCPITRFFWFTQVCSRCSQLISSHPFYHLKFSLCHWDWIMAWPCSPWPLFCRCTIPADQQSVLTRVSWRDRRIHSPPADEIKLKFCWHQDRNNVNPK